MQHTEIARIQAEEKAQQEMRNTLQAQQAALRADQDAAIAKEIGRTSSVASLLRRAEKDLVQPVCSLKVDVGTDSAELACCRREPRVRPGGQVLRRRA